MEHLRVLPLHKYKQYVNDCAKLLNSEWPRSETIRMKSLETSCDSFPTHLVMVYTQHDDDSDASPSQCCKELNSNSNSLSSASPHKETVVGHTKISKLWSIPDGCFIESVVIHKKYRGKGWGKLLMEKVELFIKELGNINVIFLTTIDKQSFYNKIGYKETEPIPLFGGSLSSTGVNISSTLSRLVLTSEQSQSQSQKQTQLAMAMVCNRVAAVKRSKTDTNVKHRHPPTPPPPPPPPFPISVSGFHSKQQRSKYNHCDSRKTFMVKVIHG